MTGRRCSRNGTRSDGFAPLLNGSDSMFRMSNLTFLIAVAVGAAGGWAGASGRLDSLLKAVQKPATETTNAVCPLSGSECCNSPDKTAALAVLANHNRKVSANLQKDGKKP